MHQFCRVGRHAFIGGYSVVTKDALPFAKTVGNRPARIYGLNTIGLVRRGISAEVIAKLQAAYRYLLTSKLNTTRALAEIERDPALRCAEVQYLVDFIRTSTRGVILRRDADATGRGRGRGGRVGPAVASATPARSDRRQRPLPVPGPRRRARAGARASPSSPSRTRPTRARVAAAERARRRAALGLARPARALHLAS